MRGEHWGLMRGEHWGLMMRGEHWGLMRGEHCGLMRAARRRSQASKQQLHRGYSCRSAHQATGPHYHDELD